MEFRRVLYRTEVNKCIFGCFWVSQTGVGAVILPQFHGEEKLMKRIEPQVSGGCQCGAVRYHASAMLDTAHLCHCRMCQKAVGNMFAALVAAPRDAPVCPRGAPAVFHCSTLGARGLRRLCGTAVFSHFVEAERMQQ